MTSDIAGNPETTPAWQQLETAAVAAKETPLNTLLDESGRYDEFSLQLDGLLYDFSRQRIDGRVLDLLVELAEQRDLRGHIEALCSGATVNLSESRAALHTALRASGPTGIKPGGEDVDGLVQQELGRFLAFARHGAAGEPCSRAGEGAHRWRAACLQSFRCTIECSLCNAQPLSLPHDVK